MRDSGNNAIYAPLRQAVISRDEQTVIDLLIFNPSNSIVQKINSQKLILQVFKKAKNDEKSQESITKILRSLLDFGADINVKNEEGLTALHFAITNRMPQVVNLLVSRNANLDVLDKSGNSMIHLLIKKGYVGHRTAVIEILESLVDSGANLDIKNKEGQTALHLAIKNRMTHVIDLLISHNANLDIQDKDGNSIIHILLDKGNLDKKPWNQASIIEILELLLDSEANVNLENNKGLTALDLAIKNQQNRVTDFLISRDAKWNVCDENGDTKLHLLIESEFEKLRKCQNNLNPFEILEVKERSANLIKTVVAENLEYVDYTNSDGDTPLHLAAQRNLLDAVLILLKYTKKSNILNVTKMTAFQYFESAVCDRKNCEYKLSTSNYEFSFIEKICEKFLNKGFLIDFVGDGNTFLHYALYEHERSFAKLLLEHIKNVDLRDDKGNTALNIILNYDQNTRDDEELILILLTKGADVQKCNNKRSCPLIAAVEKRKIKILKIFEKHGVDFCRHYKNGNLLLYFLKSKVECDGGIHLEIFNLLIDKGCDVNTKDRKGVTPLHVASQYGKNEIVKKLIKYGANVNERELNYGDSPLHKSITYRHNKITRLLIKHGINVNAQNDKGITPLHLASKYSKNKILKIIIKHGANVNSRESVDGYTPLHTAVKRKRMSLLEFLIKNKADVNAKTKKGQTILHLTCLEDTRKCLVGKLIKLDARLDIMDKKGSLPLHIAIREQNSQAINQLLKFGADINDHTHALSRADYFSADLDIKDHLINLKAAGMPIDDKLKDIIQPNDVSQQVYEDCLKEIESLKKDKISKFKSLYDLLHMNRNIMSALVTKKKVKLKEYIKSQMIKEEYPRYHLVIESIYRMGVERRRMLESAKCAWYELTNFQLPELCLHEIFSYFSNVGLRSMLEAANIR